MKPHLLKLPAPAIEGVRALSSKPVVFAGMLILAASILLLKEAVAATKPERTLAQRPAVHGLSANASRKTQ